MHRSSPLRSTLNTNVITGLDMCKVCTAIDQMIFAQKGCCPEWSRGVFLFDDAFVVFLFESENRDFGVPI